MTDRDDADDPRHLSEGERALRALVLGAALGFVLALLARRGSYEPSLRPAKNR